MSEQWRLLAIIVVVISLLTGCCYRCCDVLDGPSVDWPEKLSLKPVKSEAPPVEKLPKTPEPIPQKLPEPKPEPFPGQTIPQEPTQIPQEPFDLEIHKEQVKLESTLQGEPVGIVATPHNVECLIRNNGNKIAATYQLKITLPPGLHFVDRPQESTITIDFKELGPKGALSHPFKVISDNPAVFLIKAEVIYQGVPAHTSTLSVEFRSRPKLGLKLEGPQRVNMESQFEYVLTVKNESMIVLENVKARDKLQDGQMSPGLIYISSTPPGVYNEEKGYVTWPLGNLEPGQEKVIRLKVTTIEKGTIVNKAVAMDAGNLTFARATIQTEAIGAIGLQINCYDSEDPIEVNENTTYVAEISNQGLKDATNVRVRFILPLEGLFVNAIVVGAELQINHKVEKNFQGNTEIIFDPVEFLKPGKKITFKVTIKVIRAGDLINIVQLQSNEFSKTIRSQEGTKAITEKQK